MKERSYLLIYDAPASRRLSGKRYYKFRSLVEDEGGIRLQHSVYLFKSLEAAKKAATLLDGNVRIFKVLEVIE